MDAYLRVISSATRHESSSSSLNDGTVMVVSALLALCAMSGPVVRSEAARAACDAQVDSGVSSACALDSPISGIALFDEDLLGACLLVGLDCLSAAGCLLAAAFLASYVLACPSDMSNGSHADYKRPLNAMNTS